MPYQAEAAAAAEKKKKKKKKRKVLFVFELLLLIVLAVGLFAAAKLSKVQRVKIKDDEIKQKVEEQLPEYTAKPCRDIGILHYTEWIHVMVRIPDRVIPLWCAVLTKTQKK